MWNKINQCKEMKDAPPLFFWTGSYVAQLPLNSLIVKDDFEILIPVSSSRIVRHHSLFTQ